MIGPRSLTATTGGRGSHLRQRRAVAQLVHDGPFAPEGGVVPLLHLHRLVHEVRALRGPVEVLCGRWQGKLVWQG